MSSALVAPTEQAEQFMLTLEQELSSEMSSTLPRSQVADALSDLLAGAAGDRLTSKVIERLEHIVDGKIQELVHSFILGRKKATARLVDLRVSAAAERRAYDLASRHREAEATRIETSRLEERFEKDLRSKSEQLAHAEYMNQVRGRFYRMFVRKSWCA